MEGLNNEDKIQEALKKAGTFKTPTLDKIPYKVNEVVICLFLC